MKRVYCAGPIGPNDAGRPLRIHSGVSAAVELLQLGLAPFSPHLWSAGTAADDIATYETWMAYDFAFLSVCDALLRIPGASPGADREVAFARAHGIPVFLSVADLICHARREGWAMGSAA